MNTDASFTRDRFTWLAYLLLAYFAYSQTIIGPAIPFLQADLDLSYTVAGLHMSAFAAGMILAGLSGSAASARFGRRAVFWGGGGGMAGGLALMALGRHELVTIAGAFVMGLWGTYLLAMIQATLADRHGERRATALTEANVVASGANVFAPALLGLSASVGLGWQVALWAPALFWVVMATSRFRVPLPAPGTSSSGATGKPLSRIFWVYWLVMVAMVAAEWSTVTWSASFLENAAGLERALASALMTAFFIATVIGRFAGSRLTRRFEGRQLLPAAASVALAGVLIFWLAATPALNVVGLFVAGLGISNLFPLGLSVTTTLAAASGSSSDRASSMVSLAAGLAIFLAPQTLGAAADSIGIQTAMGFVVGLLIAALVMIGAARRIGSGR
jgi:predicted MFS family arabinose efflux permease